MRILVVDDDTSIQEILAALLARFGHQVTPAPSGMRAVDVLKTETPDLILTDIQMPGMTGWDLLRRVRLDAATDWIPFLFLAVNPKFPDPMRCLRIGADGFLSKPFYSEELLARIGRTTQRLQDREVLLRMDLTGIPGRLGTVKVLDLLRILERKKASTTLVLSGGSEAGRIRMRDGEIEGVQLGDSWGPAGLPTLLELDEGTFSIGPYSSDVPDGARRLVLVNQLLREVLGSGQHG